MKNLQCPCCGNDLVITHRDRYQDSMEHVSNPNGTPSMKDGYQCMDEKCIAHLMQAVWTEDGGLYISRPDGIEWETYLKGRDLFDKSLIYGVNSAMGSWEFYYEIGKIEIKKRKRSYNIFNYRIDVEPQMQKGDDMKTEYLPHMWKKKFNFWKKSEDGRSYHHVISHYRMIKYYLRSFKSSYNSALFNPKANRNSIKECIDKINAQQWGRPDDRFYVKASAFLIKLLMPGRVAIIKDLAKTENICTA